MQGPLAGHEAVADQPAIVWAALQAFVAATPLLLTETDPRPP